MHMPNACQLGTSPKAHRGWETIPRVHSRPIPIEPSLQQALLLGEHLGLQVAGEFPQPQVVVHLLAEGPHLVGDTVAVGGVLAEGLQRRAMLGALWVRGYGVYWGCWERQAVRVTLLSPLFANGLTGGGTQSQNLKNAPVPLFHNRGMGVGVPPKPCHIIEGAAPMGTYPSRHSLPHPNEHCGCCSYGDLHGLPPLRYPMNLHPPFNLFLCKLILLHWILCRLCHPSPH